jgi:hypothetical protein
LPSYTFSQDDLSLLPNPEIKAQNGQDNENAHSIENQALQSGYWTLLTHPTTNIPMLNSESQVSCGGNFVTKFSSGTSSSASSSESFRWFLLRIVAMIALAMMAERRSLWMCLFKVSPHNITPRKKVSFILKRTFIVLDWSVRELLKQRFETEELAE